MPAKTSVLVLAAALATASSASARPGFGPGPEGPGGRGHFFEQRIERLADGLELTADQRAAVDRLREEMRATAEPLLAELGDAKQAIDDLLAAAAPEAQAIGEKVIATKRVKDQLDGLKSKFESDLSALLDDGQRATLDALRKLKPEGPEHGRGHFGGGPPPRFE